VTVKGKAIEKLPLTVTLCLSNVSASVEKGIMDCWNIKLSVIVNADFGFIGGIR